jgi:hypothetical protein
VARLGIVLRFDKQIIQVAKQRFYMALEARDRWETSVVVENEATREVVIVMIGQYGVDFVWNFFIELKIALV